MSNTPAWAVEAAEAIVSDLTDRKGLGDEFNNIDESIQDEIVATWATIIAAEGRKA